MIRLTKTIPWGPLSKKHVKYIHRALESQISIAEGAIRSGKTIDHCIVAALYLESCKDRIHLATGATIANAKLNIGDCNGFGLEHIFRGRCRWGKHKDNQALFINTKAGLKIVVFAGGGKADSYKKILGNSYGLWIATEINEHYDCQDSRESFIKVALGRQIAAAKPLVLWDLNPSSPNAPIYPHYIDKWTREGLANYQLFTLRDNATLTKERIAKIEQMYIPGTLWHARDILGMRCIAQGLVYPMFNKDTHVVDASGYGFTEYYVSVDYGTMNPFSAGLWGKSHDTFVRMREYYHDGRETGRVLTDEEYFLELERLIGALPIKAIVIDPSAASMIARLKRSGRYAVKEADNRVMDGIRNTASALWMEKIKIDQSCAACIAEFGAYVWSGKAGGDKPVKDKDHAMDDVRYFVQTVISGKKVAKTARKSVYGL